MGILDNLKGRLGGGSTSAKSGYNNGSGYQDEYDQHYASDDYDYGSQDAGNRQGYDDRTGGNGHDSYTPLVNMTDIRSQRIPIDEAQGPKRDRIPQPATFQRQSPYGSRRPLSNDQDAFRDGLARSQENSLVQLHQERLQMEAVDLPEFPITNVSGTVMPRSANPAARRNTGFHAAPSYRGQRHIEQLRPASYADAEEISRQLRDGAAVVLDLTGVRPELAKRLLDFSFGVTSAFQGQVDRFADRVYILTRNGALTESEMATLQR